MSAQVAIRIILACTVSFCLVSCGKKPIVEAKKANKVPVVPVTGEVTVDGKSELGVTFHCVPQGTQSGKDPLPYIGGRTNADGKFSIKLYLDEEGIPPGDYALLFYWPTESLKKRSRADELRSDRLKKKYSDEKKPVLKFTVESGKPLTLDPIALKTK